MFFSTAYLSAGQFRDGSTTFTRPGSRGRRPRPNADRSSPRLDEAERVGTCGERDRGHRGPPVSRAATSRMRRAASRASSGTIVAPRRLPVRRPARVHRSPYAAKGASRRASAAIPLARPTNPTTCISDAVCTVSRPVPWSRSSTVVLSRQSRTTAANSATRSSILVAAWASDAVAIGPVTPPGTTAPRSSR